MTGPLTGPFVMPPAQKDEMTGVGCSPSSHRLSATSLDMGEGKFVAVDPESPPGDLRSPSVVAWACVRVHLRSDTLGSVALRDLSDNPIGDRVFSHVPLSPSLCTLSLSLY